jgi:serine protease AprX
MLDTDSKIHRHNHSQNRFAVIPTHEKLNADVRYSGRGIRVAFLDSGFYPHPDFAKRIVAFHDISGEEKSMGNYVGPAAHHWHGTQTVAACAGDGLLSSGIYRGLAYEAEVILVKVSRGGRIGDAEIQDGLKWLIDNCEKYRFRIVNMSLGGDCDLPTNRSPINSLVEELIGKGVVVTIAAGNSAEMRSLPPASSPSAITVGGFSDENKFAKGEFGLYHSSFGETADGLIKPELIAPAMYVAAPILPETDDYRIAELLSLLASSPDYAFRSLLEELWEAAALTADVLKFTDEASRRIVEYALRRRKIVSTHYHHVDGTSYAAPITASVVAQMLEANPTLTPAVVKNILISTASRLTGKPSIRQGFGILNPRSAVEVAERDTHELLEEDFHPPRVRGKSIIFTYHNDHAKSVHLVGDFNGWVPFQTPLAICDDGIWRASIPCQLPGKYGYKFLIDSVRWIEDPSHALKEDDGYNGFNSLLYITDN